MKEKPSFAFEVKQEVLSYQKHPKNITSFLNGFILANAFFDENAYILRIKNEEVREKIIQFLKRIKINFTFKEGTKTYLSILKTDFLLRKEIINPSSFFAGVFCGGGNISSTESTSYHLELSSHSEENINIIINKLNSYDFTFNVFKRENKWVAYIKKLDQLSDFLTAIEAKRAFFLLQDIKIKRDIENSINRVQNIDFSNLSKIAKSSMQHVENINYMLENNLKNHFTKKELIFFKIKLNNPSLTLKELSEILLSKMKISISKSGLNHWLLKLKSVVNQYREAKKTN